MNKLKESKLKKIVIEYGEKLGYDASTFPNKFLRLVAQIEGKGKDVEKEVGIEKFCGRWLIRDKDRLINWLCTAIKPGPRYGIASIPPGVTRSAFLEHARGLYNLRTVLSFFETRVVNFYKVRNAAVRVQQNNGDSRKEVGAFLKNGKWTVEFPQFGAYLCHNEPDIKDKD